MRTLLALPHLVFPASQSVQPVAQTVSLCRAEYLPLLQMEHEERPSSELYFPAVQTPQPSVWASL